MKKFLTTIFILVILLGGILAPFGVNMAEAAGGVENMPGSCGITSFDWCVAHIVNVLFVAPASYAMAVTGTLFDVMTAISLDSKTLSQSFADSGWVVTRDLTNIVFIFILLAIAIATILQIESYGAKSLLSRLIIVALLVNFSLVITKVVIDTSNIVALQFYNAVEVKIIDGSQNNVGFAKKFINDKVTVKPKDISVVFAAAFEPQKFFTDKAIVDVGTKGGGASMFIVAMLMAATMSIIASWAFLTAGIIFLARIAMLIFLMVVAPIAFVAYILPSSRGTAEKWWSHLLNQAFVAPVFLFFIYLILGMVGDGNLTKNLFKNGDVGEDLSMMLLGLFLNFAVIITMLILAVKMSKKMSGEMGAAFISGAKMLGGLALGAGVGVTALAGRQTLGRLAGVAESKIKGMAPTSKAGQFVRHMGIKASGGLAKAGYDIRAAKIPGKVFQSTLGDVVGKAGISVGKGKTAKDVTTEKVEKKKNVKEAVDKLRMDNLFTAVGKGDANAIKNIISTMPASQARDLPNQARMNHEVIQNLEPRHLQDLMGNGDITQTEIDEIMDVITGQTTYTNQSRHLSYVNSSQAKHLWG